MNSTTQRLSSNFTLFYSIFLPVFYLVFFTSFTFVVFLLPIFSDESPTSSILKLVSLVFLLLGLLLYFSIFKKLKRVDSDEQFIFVTNYFKTVKISIESISKVESFNLLIIRISKIKLKHKGIFGDQIHLIERENMLELFAKKFGIITIKKGI